MRLVCPNCDAQYEVDGSMIPPTGRDVQCSSCGKTWFQEPEGSGEVSLANMGPKATARPEPEPTPEPEPAPPPEPEPEPEPEEDDEDETPPVPPPWPGLHDQPRDKKAMGILKEEAERELAQRERERGGRDEDDVPEPRGTVSEDTAAGSRRDLLPDIDEINSTLDATSKRPSDQQTADVILEIRRHRSGFRLGFSLVLIVVAFMIGIYLFAADIAELVPALEPAMIAYVDWGNGVRLWFDALLEASVEGLAGLIVALTNG